MYDIFLLITLNSYISLSEFIQTGILVVAFLTFMKKDEHKEDKEVASHNNVKGCYGCCRCKSWNECEKPYKCPFVDDIRKRQRAKREYYERCRRRHRYVKLKRNLWTKIKKFFRR